MNLTAYVAVTSFLTVYSISYVLVYDYALPENLFKNFQ